METLMKVMRSVIIDAPIDRVWQAVRRFDGVVDWNPGVTAAALEQGTATEVGAIRKLDIVDGSVFRETLLAHSDLDRSYSYDIIDSPLPCSNYIAVHRFIEITEGDKTLGIWSGEFDCAAEDAAQLEEIVGNGIYRDAQIALSHYLKDTSA
jgi:ligand-binding SRPBCC domain-containing protein